MKHIHILIILLVSIILGIIWATLGYGQTPFVPLGQVRPNAYGPGIHSDATGQPFTYVPRQRQHTDSQLHQDIGSHQRQPVIKPHVYGPNNGMNQYGQMVTPQKVR